MQAVTTSKDLKSVAASNDFNVLKSVEVSNDFKDLKSVAVQPVTTLKFLKALQCSYDFKVACNGSDARQHYRTFQRSGTVKQVNISIRFYDIAKKCTLVPVAHLLENITHVLISKT